MILSGHRDNTYPVPDMEALTVCHVDKSSGATYTGEFVSLSTVANKASALLLFLAIKSENKDRLAVSKLYIWFIQILNIFWITLISCVMWYIGKCHSFICS